MTPPLLKIFETALQHWQSTQLSAPDAQHHLIDRLRGIADENTNLYLVDMRRPSADQFGFHVAVANVDLRTANPPDDTLGSHPDRAYSARDVLPQYAHVAETGMVRFDALKSRMWDVYARYDRLILPIFAGRKAQKPSHAVALSRPTLIVHPGQGDTRDLSPRELTIFNMVASGLTTKEVARETHSSPRTIETHVNSIKRKMGARNITHAVALYLLRATFE